MYDTLYCVRDKTAPPSDPLCPLPLFFFFFFFFSFLFFLCEGSQFSLPFDPSLAFHTFTMKWSANQIVWLLDGTPIRILNREEDKPWPKFSMKPMVSPATLLPNDTNNTTLSPYVPTSDEAISTVQRFNGSPERMLPRAKHTPHPCTGYGANMHELLQ